ncbi:hypothetical protein AB205_0109230, partial [Aquarana catesbeiana]
YEEYEKVIIEDRLEKEKARQKKKQEQMELSNPSLVERHNGAERPGPLQEIQEQERQRKGQKRQKRQGEKGRKKEVTSNKMYISDRKNFKKLHIDFILEDVNKIFSA